MSMLNAEDAVEPDIQLACEVVDCIVEQDSISSRLVERWTTMTTRLRLRGSALEMDSVVHDDAAVISNVLDQLNDLHDAETKAEGVCPGDGQRCSNQQRPGPAQRGG